MGMEGERNSESPVQGPRELIVGLKALKAIF